MSQASQKTLYHHLQLCSELPKNCTLHLSPNIGLVLSLSISRMKYQIFDVCCIRSLSEQASLWQSSFYLMTFFSTSSHFWTAEYSKCFLKLNQSWKIVFDEIVNGKIFKLNQLTQFKKTTGKKRFRTNFSGLDISVVKCQSFLSICKSSCIIFQTRIRR